ncbi:MAG TPA: hypothetical protein VLN49_22155 [Gemmatimonadaceae bacterium]|nr:hypothetical protein [Gemmatimonadaceae bacterium]
MISLILLSAAFAASSDSCQPASRLDAATLLRRAVQSTGLDRHRSSVLQLHAFDLTQHTFESDRTYPPSLAEVKTFDEWFDVSTGADRIESHSTIAGYEFGASTIGTATASYAVRDTALMPSESMHGTLYETRPLNVWAMLEDWLAATDVRVEARCVYRDYPRVVLTRRGARGQERLFVDPKTGYPIKLDRIEPHYLWGQVHVEVVYSTWERVDDAHLPLSSFRLEDGTTMVTRTFGGRRFVSRDSAPSLAVPARATAMAMAPPPFLAPTQPDTVRVSDAIYLLRNRGFAETIALARDTVFVFDATQGEARVQEDSAWIAKLFPGRHPTVLVVTDLAWPHVAGVRAWVARGAIVVAHPAAREFLARVVNRRWTLAPDLLERRRQRAPFSFRAVDDSLLLAGGDIVVFPIDGVASEVALAAFVRPSRFLWASDYVQNLSAPTQYVDEVVSAVARMRVSPAMVAAEHTPLSPWDRVAKLAERLAAP